MESDPFSGGDTGAGAELSGPDGAAGAPPAPASHEVGGGSNPVGGGSIDDIESLLAEFDTQAKPKTPAADAPDATVADIPNDTSGDSADELMRLQLGAISNRTILQSVLDHQIALQERQHQEHLKQQETADFQKIVGLANDHLEGLPIPEDFANRYLAAEYQFNPELKEAWDHRRDSPEHDDYATRVIKRVFKQMRKSASRIPDLQATEDRAAVTAAVRGSSNQAPPSDTAADYRRRVNNMSDAEFRKHADEVMDR